MVSSTGSSFGVSRNGSRASVAESVAGDRTNVGDRANDGSQGTGSSRPWARIGVRSGSCSVGTWAWSLSGSAARSVAGGLGVTVGGSGMFEDVCKEHGMCVVKSLSRAELSTDGILIETSEATLLARLDAISVLLLFVVIVISELLKSFVTVAIELAICRLSIAIA